jgi:uncharacterized protein (DUF302 family)
MSSPQRGIVEHLMTRIDIPTGIAFDDFRRAFEQAAPPFDADSIQALTDQGGSWNDVKAAVAASAPNDLLVYGMIDATSLFTVAGHTTRAIEYLVGNHVIAETMFRHDPKALLYAPLRFLLYSAADGTAVLSIDRPSSAFASLEIPDVTEVGILLDHKVAALLKALRVDFGDVLSSER